MKVIVLEGIDGSGKSTMAKTLASKLIGLGVNATYVHFPDCGSIMGGHIYDYLNGKMSTKFTDVNFYAQWMMYALDRYEFFLKNAKDLENKVVVCDRYTTSSMIYQTATMTLQMKDAIIKAAENINTIFDKTGEYPDGYSYNPLQGFLDIDPDAPIDRWIQEFWLSDTKFDKTIYACDPSVAESLYIPDGCHSLTDFIAHITTMEYVTLGIPKPAKIYYISAGDDEESSQERMKNMDKKLDAFEENADFEKLVHQIAVNIAFDNENWKIIYNHTNLMQDAVQTIIDDIIETLPLSIRYNLCMQRPAQEG